jgi:predicted ATPase/DNA-binding SARP family transcriptional activator/predicted negative regulator of RcsB-dependent stress response
MIVVVVSLQGEVMAHLAIALLGPFRVTLDEKPIAGLKSNKIRALLSYLAVEAERPHHRRVLAELLWPNRPESDSLGHLRYALSNLRRAIGDREAAPPFLCITRDTLQFNCTSDCWLDIRAFTELASAAKAHANPIDLLEQAVQLYQGNFMEGFHAGDSAEFEEWMLFKREQLARQALSALRCLTTIYEQRGEYTRAQAYAWRQIEMEPWQEGARRQLMRLLALDDQRAAALAQYEAYCHLLTGELGVEPTQETTALYEQIKAGDRLPVPEPKMRSRPASLRPSVRQESFVGRGQELTWLTGHLEAALARRGQVVFVIGGAGSGKTALVNEFARQAMDAHSDLIVARGKCNAQSGISDPYLPFHEILEMLTGDVEDQRAGGAITDEHARRLWAQLPDTVQALLDKGPDLIDTIIPGTALAVRAEAFAPRGAPWRDRLEELAARRMSDDVQPEPGARQTTLFEQVTDVLQELARQHPLISVLDDLQWADNGSISLLFHLGRRLAGSRLLIIGAYRPGDVAPGRSSTSLGWERHPLEPVVNELQRDLGDIQMDLEHADGRQFIEALIDREPNRLGAAFRQTLYDHTGGNPLFAVEFLHGLQERGDLVQNENGQWIEGSKTDWEQMPARVEAVIAERIARLPFEWQGTLAAASVEGETFIAEIVARALELDEKEMIRRLSGPLTKQYRLVVAQSLRRSGAQRLSRYRFRHHLFQKYLYNHIDEVERACLHETIGNALETVYETQPDEAATQLAYHFEAAGVVDKTVDYLLQAGKRAVRLSAHREAIEHFTRGLELLETLPKSSERDQKELALQLALGVPLQAIKSYSTPERGQAYARAYELCLQVGEMAQLSQTLLMQWSFKTARGKHDEARVLTERLLELAQQTQDPSHAVMAHTAFGTSQIYSGKLSQARDHLEQALAIYDPKLHHDLITPTGQNLKVTGLSYLSWALWILGYPDQALQRVDEAIALARELDHPFSLGFALGVGGGVIHLRCGKYKAALEEANELQQLWEKMGFSLYRAWHLCIRGRVLAETGPVEEGISSLQEGIAECESLGIIASHTQQLYNLAAAYRNAGLVQEGLDVIEQALTLMEKTGERHFEAELLRYKGELLLMQADGNEAETEAEDCLHQALGVARRQDARSWELRATISLCHLWQHRGEQKAARQALAEIYGWFNEGFDTRDLHKARALLEALEP